MTDDIVTHPYGGNCRVTFGYLPGDRWTYRGYQLKTLHHGVEVPALGGIWPHRRRAEEAIDDLLAAKES